MSALIPICHPAWSRRRFRRLALALILPLALPAAAAIPGVELVDRTTIASYIDANGPSLGPFAASPDSRFVLFSSVASNLVPGDNNGSADLFLHDRSSGALERVNLANDGSEANSTGGITSFSRRGGVSADGRLVTFASAATNLVAEPSGGYVQVYRRDRLSATTTLISRGSDGLPANGDVFAGATTPDGRYTVLATSAANFPGAVAGGGAQIYRRDASDGSLVRVTVSFDGQQTHATGNNLEISDDGRFVLFSSYADNLVPGTTSQTLNYFLRDLVAGTTWLVSVTDAGAPTQAPSFDVEDTGSVDRLSADGRYAVFSTRAPLSPGDTDNRIDIYRFDRLSGTTTLVSGGSVDDAALFINLSPSISADGRYVSFISLPAAPTGSVQMYIRDMVTGMLTPLAFPSMRFNGYFVQSLSRDGSTVFMSTAELPPRNQLTQIYRFDVATSALARISQPPAWSFGAYANGNADLLSRPSLSGDARFVAFASTASNLVSGDGNGTYDVFLRDRLNATTERISVRANGSESDCPSDAPTLTPDARYVVFESCGALAAPASGTQNEIYRYDRTSGSLEVVSVAGGGVAANGGSFDSHISDDGRYVAFSSCASNLVATSVGGQCQVYLRDMNAGVTMLVSRSNSGEPGNSFPSIGVDVSGDGRFVGYSSNASNLVAGDTNNVTDAFVFDRVAGTTERVSVGPSGQQSRLYAYFRGFDHSGNLALFESSADSFTSPPTSTGGQRCYLRDRGAASTTPIIVPGDTTGNSLDASISPDGRLVAFITYLARSGVSSYDDSLKYKLFVLDRNDGRYRALTWFTGDRPQSETRKPQLSADGQWIAFASTRDDLSDEDGNGQFADVFLTRSNDPIFADDFD